MGGIKAVGIGYQVDLIGKDVLVVEWPAENASHEDQLVRIVLERFDLAGKVFDILERAAAGW